MKALLGLAHAVDKINGLFGRLAVWAIFLSCMVSAGNASVRYLINNSSNAWLEIQWYLFGFCVMLGAARVLQVNEHVRVDVLYSRMSSRTKCWIDLFGMIFFLMPGALLVAWMSWPWFVEAFTHNELSSNAGGLIRWPVKLVLPMGFALLAAQGLSEIVKRIGYLMGVYEMEIHYERPLQ